MSFKLRAKYFEKQVLRPMMRTLKRILPFSRTKGIPPDLQLRLESLESRILELEQLVQEDIGLKLSAHDDRKG